MASQRRGDAEQRHGSETAALSAGFLRAISGCDDQHQIAQALADHVRSALGLDAASVHEQDGGRLQTWAAAGSPTPPYLARVAQVLAGRPIEAGFGHVAEGPPRWIVLCDRARPPAAADRELVAASTAAACVAAAMARRAGLDRTAARAGRTLVELGQALALEHGVANVLHLLTLAVARLIDGNGVSTWQSEPDGLRLVAAFGHPPRRRPLPDTRAARTPALDELTASRRIRMVSHEQQPELVGRDGHAVVVPIGERQGNRAVLVIDRSATPDDAEEALLLGVADQALLALENERLLEEQRRALEDVVACLGRALALRHRETGEHSDRLAADCVAVASVLGIRGEELRDVSFAAALHDLGKIGVPERVLDNTGPLDADGWRLIRAHPELGAAIIDPVDALHGAAELVRCCHEHWNGSGYPRGLAGENIPLGSRVIFACDAYHAMCEDRPYQARLSPNEARGRMGELSGVDFDPRVVEVLLDHLASSPNGDPARG